MQSASPKTHTRCFHEEDEADAQFQRLKKSYAEMKKKSQRETSTPSANTSVSPKTSPKTSYLRRLRAASGENPGSFRSETEQPCEVSSEKKPKSSNRMMNKLLGISDEDKKSGRRCASMNNDEIMDKLAAKMAGANY